MSHDPASSRALLSLLLFMHPDTSRLRVAITRILVKPSVETAPPRRRAASRSSLPVSFARREHARELQPINKHVPSRYQM